MVMLAVTFLDAVFRTGWELLVKHPNPLRLRYPIIHDEIDEPEECVCNFWIILHSKFTGMDSVVSCYANNIQ